MKNIIFFLTNYILNLFFYCIHPFFIFFKIKFIPIDLSRIGSFYYLDWYISLKKMASLKKKYYYFFFYYNNNNIANLYWKNIWSKYCYNGFFSIIFLKYYQFCVKKYDYVIPLQCLPTNHLTFLDIKKYGYTKDYLFYKNNLQCILSNNLPNISFTKNEILKGNELLNKLNLKKGEYVCFNSRDSNYLKTSSPQINFDYHHYRNSNIITYIKSVEYLSNHKIKSLRMGKFIENKINYKDHNFFEYSDSSFQNDFADIFLLSNCKFLISSDCGITILPECFRIPIVYTNWPLLWRISKWNINGVIIFKKIFSNKLKRFLSFKEMIANDFSNKKNLLRYEAKWIDNSPEEILSATKEMNLRLTNNWKSTKEEIDLQNKFWKIFENNDIKSSNLHVGSIFLKNNSELL